MNRYFHVKERNRKGKEVNLRIYYQTESPYADDIQAALKEISKDWLEEPRGVRIGFSTEIGFYFFFDLWVDDIRFERIHKEYQPVLEEI